MWHKRLDLWESEVKFIPSDWQHLYMFDRGEKPSRDMLDGYGRTVLGIAPSHNERQTYLGTCGFAQLD
jgi:hypothetical protein